MDDFEPRIRSVPEAGFELVLDQSDGVGRHVFCGDHEIAGADCPNCCAPLMQMMVLDVSDEQLTLGQLGVERVPLLFCWRCNIAQGVTQYQLLRDGGIELLKFKRGTQGPDFPYDDYPESFPRATFDLVAVSGEQSLAPRHQVGGKPYLMQGLRDIRCKVCRRRMSFLACVADGATEGRSFVDNSFVQVLFHICPTDAVVASYHECD